jgi:hypothetical protein
MVAKGVGILRAIGNDTLLREGARRTEVLRGVLGNECLDDCCDLSAEAQVKARACLQGRFNFAGQRRLAIASLRT